VKTWSTRLNHLERNRSSRQVVKAYLLKQQTFDSVEALIDWHFSDEALLETNRSREQLYQVATASIPKEQHGQTRQKLSREMVFLFTLAMAPIAVWEAQKYQVLYRFSQACLLLRQAASLDKIGCENLFQEQIETCFNLILELQEAATFVSHNYFDGIPLLLKYQLVENDHLLKQLAGMVSIIEDRPVWESMVQERVREKSGPALAEQFMTEARMAVYDSEGYTMKVNQLYQPSKKR
jgi:hypothetical protein